MRGKLALLCQFARELTRLGFCRDLAGEQQPEHTLGNDFLATRRCWELLLAVGNGQAVEPDALVMQNGSVSCTIFGEEVVRGYLDGVKNGGFPEHGLESAHTTDEVLNLSYS